MVTQQTKDLAVVIAPPNIQHCECLIIGTSPFVQNRFSAKAQEEIREAQERGSARKKKREPKDFNAAYEAATHKTPEGRYGIPAPALRNAMISACRLSGFQMTKAKLSIFIEADGYDAEDHSPLIFFTDGEPEYFQAPVRLALGAVDLRARPMWQPGWKAKVRIRFDGDQFQIGDVINLLSRAGLQVGIGEGRPDSKTSNGQGWGLFRVGGPEDE